MPISTSSVTDRRTGMVTTVALKPLMFSQKDYVLINYGIAGIKGSAGEAEEKDCQ